MTSPKCSIYEKCEAPLCPLDECSLKNGVWYPDEEICRAKAIDWSKQAKHAVKTQRRLAKKLGSLGADAGYYTWDMLARLCLTRETSRGLDPDKPREEELRRWEKERSRRPSRNLVRPPFRSGGVENRSPTSFETPLYCVISASEP